MPQQDLPFPARGPAGPRLLPACRGGVDPAARAAHRPRPTAAWPRSIRGRAVSGARGSGHRLLARPDPPRAPARPASGVVFQ